jgi:hypothetical protein
VSVEVVFDDMKNRTGTMNGNKFIGKMAVGIKADVDALFFYCSASETYIEIGSAFGASACIAGYAVTGDVYCVDAFLYKDVAGIKQTPEVIQSNWALMGHAPERLHIYEHRTPPLPEELQTMQFDVGLIDGGHSEAQARADWECMKDVVTRYMLFHDVKENPLSKPGKVFVEAAEDPDWKRINLWGVMGVLKRV